MAEGGVGVSAKISGLPTSSRSVLIANSEYLMEFWRTNNPGTCHIFSIDVEDLYYLFPMMN